MRVRKPVLVAAILATFLLLVAGAASAATEKSHVEKSFTVAAGDTVAVRVGWHDVEASAAPGDSVHVVADTEVTAASAQAKRIVERCTPRLSQEGSTVRVDAEGGSGGFIIGFLRQRGKIRITLPPGVTLDVHTGSGDVEVQGDLGDTPVTLHTGSGDLRVDGAVRSVDAATGSGDVTVGSAVRSVAVETGSGDVRVLLDRPAERVEVTTASGDLELHGGAGEVRLEAASGDITAAALGGSANIESSSGDVRATFAALPAGSRVEVSSSSGDVTLRIPEGTALAGQVHTASGDIDSDFPGSRNRRGNRLELSGGPDAVALDVHSSSGDVTLRRGPAAQAKVLEQQ